jgi:hypothetical protein
VESERYTLALPDGALLSSISLSPPNQAWYHNEKRRQLIHRRLSVHYTIDSMFDESLKTARAVIGAARTAYSEARSELSQSSDQGYCSAVNRSLGRRIMSSLNPRSFAHSIRSGRRKAISTLAMADSPETKSEEADRLRLEAEIQSTLAEIGRDAWRTLQDLSGSESLARSWLNYIESQLAKPAASVSRLQRWFIISSWFKVPSEGQKLLRQMQSNQKDYLAGCAEFRKTIETQVKRAIATAPTLSLSTVITFSSFFPPGSSQATSTGDSGTNTISLRGRGSDDTLASLPGTASDPVTQRSVTWADLVDRASSKSNERQSTLPTSSLPSSSPDWAPEAEG